MIIENHALWGEEPTEEYPATFTYLGAEPLPDKPNGRRPAVIICGGGGFTHIAPHEQDPVAFAFLDHGYQAFVLNYVTLASGWLRMAPSLRSTVTPGKLPTCWLEPVS